MDQRSITTNGPLVPQGPHSEPHAYPLAYTTKWREDLIALHQCGPLDAEPLTLWADAALVKDFFFRRGHWAKILRSPDYQVYAIGHAPSDNVAYLELVGIAITHHTSSLLNLYLDPFWRNLGIGSVVIEILKPERIRCKTDGSAGDPTPFYTRLGYEVIQTGEGKHGTITVLRRIPCF